MKNIERFRMGWAVSKLWRGSLFLVPFVLTLEVGTRIEQTISSGAPLVGEYSYDAALTIQDGSGVIGRPYGRYEKWTLNSFGFRGPEFDTVPPPGVERIVTVGASETFGLYESPGNEWPRQLERILKTNGRAVEVLNASLAGMTLRRRIEHFAERGVTLEPDAVILMLEYPSYVGIARERERGPETSAQVEPDSALAGVALQPRFPRRFKDAVVPRLPAPIGHALRVASVRLRVLRQKRALGSTFQGTREVTEQQLAEYGKDVQRFLSIAEEYQIRVLLLAPAIRLDEETALDFSANWPFIHPDWILKARERFLEITRPLALAAQAPLLDLDAFVPPGQKQDLMPDAFHFSDEGAEIVAKVVAEEMALARSNIAPELSGGAW